MTELKRVNGFLGITHSCNSASQVTSQQEILGGNKYLQRSKEWATIVVVK